MGYGKCWKVPVSKLESLIANADEEDICLIEVWHDTSDKIEDCELWLSLATGWEDRIDDTPPVNPTT